MKVVIASDHAGYEAKKQLVDYLQRKGFSVADFGANSTESCDYPDFAYAAAIAVSKGEFDRGILICGTGVGISIAANKVKGIRCALCYNEFCAEFSRRHNDAQIMAMGARTIPVETMKTLADIFLTTDFEGGRHSRRVNKISAIERGEDPLKIQE